MDGSYQKMFKPDDTLDKSVLKKNTPKLDNQIAMATGSVSPCHNKEHGLSAGICLMASFSIARKVPEV